MTPDELKRRLTLPELPRSAAYDPQWTIDHAMGPNVVWLTEALTDVMDLQPGMRVLDMGCGTALSSIFLAREFDGVPPDGSLLAKLAARHGIDPQEAPAQAREVGRSRQACVYTPNRLRRLWRLRGSIELRFGGKILCLIQRTHV